ncbi:MAG: EF-P lysine aminoacylase GenX [Sinobacteraceae bacterium]|nr:EF-P lysine aminoacylase GenX [Nevskiaceae bacterium]
MVDWKPTAQRTMLQLRGALLAHARHFFADRGVLEVDTPIVVNAPVTDVHIHSARVQFADDPRTFFLHTSPEYAMKRLLAAGSGDIYQICHVVRGLERGRQHNAEFTLIEWYRVGYTLDRLMSEVDTLVRHLLGDVAFSITSERLTYRDAFLRELRLDPLTASLEELAAAANTVGFAQTAGRDELLELLIGAVIGPRLGRDALTFIYDYPASQAALARLNPDDPRTALRFELYCRGVELANGFEELASAPEQRARFEHDNQERQRRGLPVHAIDDQLLAALESGLPPCAGVALGFDRTLMLAADAGHIDEVLAFPTDRA